MKELKKDDSMNIYAGSLSAGAYGLIAAGISFFVGLLDGITRPFRCR